MKTLIEELVSQLQPFAEQVGAELKREYALSDFEMIVDSRFANFRYQLHGYDGMGEFVCSNGDTYPEALDSFKSKLTTHAAIKAAKLQKAKHMLAEAEAMP